MPCLKRVPNVSLARSMKKINKVNVACDSCPMRILGCPSVCVPYVFDMDMAPIRRVGALWWHICLCYKRNILATMYKS